MLDEICREYGPLHTDEDLRMATLFMPDAVEDLRWAQRIRAERASLYLAGTGSVAELVREAGKVSGVRHIRLTMP